MSFYKIKNPQERNRVINEYLSTQQRIKNHNMKERVGEIEHIEQLNITFKPIVNAAEKTTTAIKESLNPLQEKIEKVSSDANKTVFLNSKIGLTEDTYFGIVKYKDKFLMGNKEVFFGDDP